jgi:hypothetical protein
MLEFAVAKKRRAGRCGNDAPWKAWKTQKSEFPTLSTALGNPAKGAGFPHFHSDGGGCLTHEKTREKQ